jgi:heavy metal translocating P-type ATPase
MPVRKEAGAIVLSGSVNLDGVLDVKATRRSSESQYAQIIRLVAEAQERKAPIHRLADRFAVVFTALTLITATLAWVFTGDTTYALAVLVVATPCPLILATPIAIMSGIDRAARRGIIVKSGATMEQLGEVDVAVFDKTGTLTLGTPLLNEIQPVASSRPVADEDALLQMVASVEQFSSHILARAVVHAARDRHLALLPVAGFTEVPGKGASGQVPDPVTRRPVSITLGNTTHMRYHDIPVPDAVVRERDQRTLEGQIVSFLAVNGEITGLLIFADAPRPELAHLNQTMKDAGIRHTILLTGDGEVVARQIGALAGIDQVVAHCLPNEKVKVVAELEAQHHRVLMIGDGVNDAPALALAKVGIAMGSQGLTASAAVADAVLLSPDILQVAGAVRIGRTAMRIALQGIFLGMGLSIVAMIFAAMGFIAPAAGAILQEGIDVIVILNALRVLRA